VLLYLVKDKAISNRQPLAEKGPPARIAPRSVAAGRQTSPNLFLPKPMMRALLALLFLITGGSRFLS
jgi:hypothetical protein